jgi:hypothetical protein
MDDLCPARATLLKLTHALRSLFMLLECLLAHVFEFRRGR